MKSVGAYGRGPTDRALYEGEQVTIAGHEYRVTRFLRRSDAKWELYAAADAAAARDVLLIVLCSDEPGDQSSFHASARAVADTQHRSVAKLLQFGQATSGYWVAVMEQYEGTLASNAAGSPALPKDKALRTVQELLGALQLLAARGYSCADLSGERLFVDDYGTAVIWEVDAGSATVEETERVSARSAARLLLGLLGESEASLLGKPGRSYLASRERRGKHGARASSLPSELRSAIRGALRTDEAECDAAPLADLRSAVEAALATRTTPPWVVLRRVVIGVAIVAMAAGGVAAARHFIDSEDDHVRERGLSRIETLAAEFDPDANTLNAVRTRYEDVIECATVARDSCGVQDLGEDALARTDDKMETAAGRLEQRGAAMPFDVSADAPSAWGVWEVLARSSLSQEVRSGATREQVNLLDALLSEAREHAESSRYIDAFGLLSKALIENELADHHGAVAQVGQGLLDELWQTALSGREESASASANYEILMRACALVEGLQGTFEFHDLGDIEVVHRHAYLEELSDQARAFESSGQWLNAWSALVGLRSQCDGAALAEFGVVSRVSAVEEELLRVPREMLDRVPVIAQQDGVCEAYREVDRISQHEFATAIAGYPASLRVPLQEQLNNLRATLGDELVMNPGRVRIAVQDPDLVDGTITSRYEVDGVAVWFAEGAIEGEVEVHTCEPVRVVMYYGPDGEHKSVSDAFVAGPGRVIEVEVSLMIPAQGGPAWVDLHVSE